MPARPKEGVREMFSDTISFKGNFPEDARISIFEFIQEFMRQVELEAFERHAFPAMVRSMLPCDAVLIFDDRVLWLVAQRKFSGDSAIGVDKRGETLAESDVLYHARWEFGLEQYFYIAFPSRLLTLRSNDRRSEIAAIAKAHVESEIQRVDAEMNVLRVNPIFGPVKYQVDSRLVFVLMPFDKDLTEIYNCHIKPVVEESPRSLVCRRADDIKSNKAIMQDVWKSICEARIVVADMTRLNANVMYELGIAHTLGKETILIYQKPENAIKFPFDLLHIRRIEYENTAVGGNLLRQEFSKTLDAILAASTA